MSYNSACGARLDCSDRTLFSGLDEEGSMCTGDSGVQSWLQHNVRISAILLFGMIVLSLLIWALRLAHTYLLTVRQANDWRTSYLPLLDQRPT